MVLLDVSKMFEKEFPPTPAEAEMESCGKNWARATPICA